MEQLGQVLKGMGPQDKDVPLGLPIRLMLGLPPTETVRLSLAGAQNEYNIKHLADRLLQCEQRDALQASRPEGCWCLGGAEPKHNQWGGAVYCTCPEGQQAKAEAQVAEQKRRALAIETTWLNKSGVPLRFQNWRLQTSPLVELAARLTKPSDDVEADEEWQKAVEAWDGSWFLWGAYGVGKTGLAVGYAYDWLSNSYDDYGGVPSILFRSVPDLLSELRSTYGRQDGPTEQEVLDRYQSAGLLVLDDLGAEHISGSGWVEDRLYQVIGNRHSAGRERPVMFTSNLSPQQLAQRIGERIVWRIVEMCGASHIVEVKGPNLRDVKH